MPHPPQTLPYLYYTSSPQSAHLLCCTHLPPSRHHHHHQVAAKYLTEYADGCFKFRPHYASERQIMEIKVREDSPHWLVEETERTRKGLMKLRQNVCLIRDPEDGSKFYPRWVHGGTWTHGGAHMHLGRTHGRMHAHTCTLVCMYACIRTHV